MKIKFDACVYKTQLIDHDKIKNRLLNFIDETPYQGLTESKQIPSQIGSKSSLDWDCHISRCDWDYGCLLYTSPSPRDPKTSRMPSSA